MKSIICLCVVLLSCNCFNGGQYEKAVDYFYPLEKGKAYIYFDKIGKDNIIKIVKIMEVTVKKNSIVVKTSVTQEIPQKIKENIERKISHKILEKNESEKEYEVEKYNINEKYIFNNKENSYIYLKGPIRKGLKWIVRLPSIHFNYQKSEIDESFIKSEALVIDPSLAKKEIKYNKYLVTISEIKNMIVLGQERKCIVLNLSLISSKSNEISSKAKEKMENIIRMYFCKGIGYIGSSRENNEMDESLIDIKKE